MSRVRTWACVFASLSGLAGCAAPATTTYAYPNPGRLEPVVVVLCEVQGIFAWHAGLRVAETIYGDAPQGIRLNLDAFFFSSTFGGCGHSLNDPDSPGWVLEGDRMLAVLKPGEDSKASRPTYELLFARWFHGPFDDLTQEVLKQTGVDVSAAEKACRDEPHIQILDLYGLVERTWVAEPLSLGELAADVRHFYRERRYWLAPDSSPWHRSGRLDPDR